MSILSLVNEINILPKRVAATNGGEYHSPCPVCGGKDRFIIWEKLGRYLCRQCQVKGDAIQFCRDFMGMDYHSACAKVRVEPKKSSSLRSTFKPKFSPVVAMVPPELWLRKANDFVGTCHHNLLTSEEAMSHLQMRGFSVATVGDFLLGWNSTDQFIKLPEWGLPQTFSETSREKKLWLPAGIVIPTFRANKVIKLKIRRNNWKEGDELPKYVEVSGSMKSPAIYGDRNKETIVLVESELDAMLVQQVASDLCCSMAIGGVGKKPDFDSDQLLRRASRLIFALDSDEAGKKAYKFWKSTYANLIPWPVPQGKSPGDAYMLGVNLREWILGGLDYLQFSRT